MVFLGLLVLKNVLKPETAPVIRVLRSAGIQTVMVTGEKNGEGAGKAGRGEDSLQGLQDLERREGCWVASSLRMDCWAQASFWPQETTC